MNKLKCAVVGVGHLGDFHAQKYASLSDVELVAVCDINASRCGEIAAKCQTKGVTNYQDLIGNIDAVSIAVPTTLHFQIAKVFLENKIHVLLEKPITTTVEQADELIRIAKKNKLIFQIGHLERFNPVLLAVEKLLDKPQFIESHRLASFQPRGTDVNVVLDLMIHDIEIIQYIINSPIKSIHATGAFVLSNQIDVANARLQFANGCVADATASRVSLNKSRIMRIFQHESYISLDFQNNKLAIYHKGAASAPVEITEIIREEKVFEQSDALKDEIKSFLYSVRTKKPPVVSGEDGRRALATAMQITQIVTEQDHQRKEARKQSEYQ